MTTDAITMTGYSYFWAEFRRRYPEIDTSNIWYEVFIDFTDFEYRKDKSLNWNLKKARKYIQKHRNDYEEFDDNTGLFIR